MGNRNVIEDKNILVLGATNSGKTKILNYPVFGFEFQSFPTIGRLDMKLEYEKGKIANLCEYGASDLKIWKQNIQYHMNEYNWDALWFVLSDNLWIDKELLYHILTYRDFPIICIIVQNHLQYKKKDIERKLQIREFLQSKDGKLSIFFIFINFDIKNSTINLLKNCVKLSNRVTI